MNISTFRWTSEAGWVPPVSSWPATADLVLCFGAAELLAATSGPHAELCARFSTAVCAGCSTAGEIAGGEVLDHSLSVLCIRFAHTRVCAARAEVASSAESFTAAARLARQLAAPDLRHILVLSDGLLVNGTSLTAGFRSVLPAAVRVTGGLAGDGDRFQRTFVSLAGSAAPHRVVAIGFYGAQLRVTHGSAGGWQPFGPHRLVTRAEGNVLYELDGQPALALYKRYLGDRAAGLPATGLLFPLHLLARRDQDEGVVRTILGLDEAAQSLTFAGDIPAGRYVRLMKASGDALIAGAAAAARSASPEPSPGPGERFAVLVSCVGRRLVLGQRLEEEIEAVLQQLGSGTAAAGFYSYGEICPDELVEHSDLHNQTMTLTVFAELP